MISRFPYFINQLQNKKLQFEGVAKPKIAGTKVDIFLFLEKEKSCHGDYGDSGRVNLKDSFA